MGASNYRLEPMNVTWNSVDLGFTVGGVELTLENTTVDIMADQYFQQKLGAFQTGTNVTVSMTLPEMTAAKWKTLTSVVGGNFTPSMGTELVGYGTSKSGTDLFSSGALLKMVPVGAGDNARNIHIHKAIPIPGSISFSGEEVSMMEVEFQAVVDLSLQAAINLFVFGDGTQTLT